jgi:hypothetical protein
MAFISSLQTKHPNYGKLFKWVTLIFLVPLLVLAIVPTVITLIAQLPGPGQLLFAFIGGVFAAGPIMIWRLRRHQRHGVFAGGIMLCIAFLVFFSIGLPTFARLIRTHFEAGTYEVLLALAAGFALFLVSLEIGLQIDRVFKKRYERLGNRLRSEDRKEAR